MLALWGGAAAAPLLQASVIFAVGSALGLSLTWAQVALAFLAASTAVGAVPAPGGIGPVDAAVVFAMVALGAPVDISATAVIGYRVLTVWLPCCRAPWCSRHWCSGRCSDHGTAKTGAETFMKVAYTALAPHSHQLAS